MLSKNTFGENLAPVVQQDPSTRLRHFPDASAANANNAGLPASRPGALSRRTARERRNALAAIGGWRLRTW